jgi:hypothetical protein
MLPMRLGPEETTDEHPAAPTAPAEADDAAATRADAARARVAQTAARLRRREVRALEIR